MKTKILEQINEELKASQIDWEKVHKLEKEFFGQDLDQVIERGFAK